jgi:hypothetical protein
MARARPPAAKTRQTARHIRERIEAGGERLWRFDDFPGLPPAAMAQALSRLTKQGLLQRVSKGVYYRPRQTAFGTSTPSPRSISRLAEGRKGVFPAGLAAASLLGFTTQVGSRQEVATSGFRLPRKLLGSDTVVHTRRPEAWEGLSEIDAALLDFIRSRGRTSELSPKETALKTLALCGERGRFARLLRVAGSEPPRARAMLGAIGQSLGLRASTLKPLRESLNPTSRFDFGMLAALPHAADWQAKPTGRPR